MAYEQAMAINKEKALRAQLKASQEGVAAYMKGVLGRQADVKLLREALGEVLTSTTKQVGICGALDRAVAALAATAPKEGE